MVAMSTASVCLFIPLSMIHSQWQCCDLLCFSFSLSPSLSPSSFISHDFFAVCGWLLCFACIQGVSERVRKREARVGLQQVNSTRCDHHPNGDDGHDHRVCPALTYQVLSVCMSVCVCVCVCMRCRAQRVIWLEASRHGRDVLRDQVFTQAAKRPHFSLSIPCPSLLFLFLSLSLSLSLSLPLFSLTQPKDP